MTYVVTGEWLAETVDGCTCGAGDGVYGHEAGCGLEPIAKIPDLIAAYTRQNDWQARWQRLEQFVSTERPEWAEPLRVHVVYSDERQIPPWYDEELGDTKSKTPGEGEIP